MVVPNEASAAPVPEPSGVVGHGHGGSPTVFPDGTDLGQAPTGLQMAVTMARQALQQRRPVFEATFASDRACARIDILVAVGVEQWDFYEVKSSTSAKPIYVDDIAFQFKVLRDAGVNVRRAILVYVNNGYIRHGDLDINDLFVRQDVTDEVDALLADVERNIDRMLEVIGLDECPQVRIGPHCDSPYTCPLHDLCWSHVPERVSELTALRWDQVDLTQGRLHVRRRKNGNASTHPLHGPELRALRRLKRDYPESPYIFTGERKGPLTDSTVRKMVARAGQRAGIPFPIHPHMLRHGCGYKLANEGQDTRAIQHYLGHRNISHTVRYTELSPERFKDFWQD
jgi:integrase